MRVLLYPIMSLCLRITSPAELLTANDISVFIIIPLYSNTVNYHILQISNGYFVISYKQTQKIRRTHSRTTDNIILSEFQSLDSFHCFLSSFSVAKSSKSEPALAVLSKAGAGSTYNVCVFKQEVEKFP